MALTSPFSSVVPMTRGLFIGGPLRYPVWELTNTEASSGLNILISMYKEQLKGVYQGLNYSIDLAHILAAFKDPVQGAKRPFSSTIWGQAARAYRV